MEKSKLTAGLPAELIPSLEFDAKGTPLIYSLGEEQLRDRRAVVEYLRNHSTGFGIGALIPLILAPLSLVALLTFAAVKDNWIVLVPGLIIPITLLLIANQFQNSAFSESRIQPLRDLRGAERRRLLRVWVDSGRRWRRALSEEKLDELQNRLGADRLQRERAAQRTVV